MVIHKEIEETVFKKSNYVTEYLQRNECKDYKRLMKGLHYLKSKKGESDKSADELTDDEKYELDNKIRKVEELINELEEAAYTLYRLRQEEIREILFGTSQTKKEIVTRGSAIENTKRKGSF